MKKYVAAGSVCMLVAACDGGFRYQGTIHSSAGTPLTECSATLTHEGRPEPVSNREIEPPNVEGSFTVAPFGGVYLLSILCADHAPHRVEVRYGSETTPSKPLDLGSITLMHLRNGN